MSDGRWEYASHFVGLALDVCAHRGEWIESEYETESGRIHVEQMPFCGRCYDRTMLQTQAALRERAVQITIGDEERVANAAKQRRSRERRAGA